MRRFHPTLTAGLAAIAILYGARVGAQPQTNEPAALSISPTIGVTWRESSEPHASYSPSLTWGAYSLIPLTARFAVRGSVEVERHSVRLQSGSLGTEPGTELEQPALDGIRLAAILRYTHTLAPRWQLWAETGIAWLRFEADTLTGSSPQPFSLAPRSGILLEIPATFGGSLLLIPHRLTASVSVTRGFSFLESGRLFQTSGGNLQIVREDSGELAHIDGLPAFESPLALSFAIDLLF